MRKIEKEEEQVAYDDPDKKIYHLCIVNLVIGLVTYIFQFSLKKILAMFLHNYCCALPSTMSIFCIVSHKLQVG